MDQKKIMIAQSKHVLLCEVAFFVSSLFCLEGCDAPLLIKLIFSLGVVFFYFFLVYPIYSNPIVALYFQEDKKWLLQNKRNEIRPAILQGDSYISRFFMILTFKLEGKFFKHSIILFPQSLDKSSFRRLHAFLLLR